MSDQSNTIELQQERDRRNRFLDELSRLTARLQADPHNEGLLEQQQRRNRAIGSADERIEQLSPGVARSRRPV